MTKDRIADLIATIDQIFGAEVFEKTAAADALILACPVVRLAEVARVLRDDPALHFNQLMDICGVDYPDCPARFEVVYQFLSLPFNRRLTVKVKVDEKTPVPTLVPLYKMAGWFEREVYDMFGVPFEGHPDLRRILTDYNFEGYPLRKDFPLSGHVEIRYDETQKKIVYEPVKLTQAYRDFDAISPWEAMPVVKAGEES